MNDLKTRLAELSERGTHAGPEILRQRVMLDLAGQGIQPRRVVPGWATAIAAAVVAVILIGTPLIVLRPAAESEPAGPDTTAPVTPTTVAAVTPIIPESLRLESLLDVSSQPIDQINGIAPGDGSLWVATNAGIVRWDLATTTSVLFRLGGDIPSPEGQSAVMIDVAPDGTVWTAGWNQYLVEFDGAAWSEPEGFAGLEVVTPRCSDGYERCDNALTAMTVGPDDRLYLGLGAKTLLIFDGRNWTEETVPPEAAGEEGNSWWAWDMDVAPDGTLWVAALDGVASYRDGTWEWYETADAVPSGVPSGEVTSVTTTSDGDVWVLFGWPPTGEIGRFDGTSWTVHEIDGGLPANQVRSIAAAPDGSVWVIDSSTGGGSLPGERAPGRVSRFDDGSWTSITVEDVGGSFGGGGATFDDTGTLWIGTGWGVVGYDGTQTTFLRVGADSRPTVEAPYTAVEGGTDILATTIAKPTPPVATCPAGSQPDLPGPARQDRPADASGPVAFDRQSGKAVLHLGEATWSFDVCTNTWARKSNSGLADGDALVYDADSDLLVEIDGELAYDVDSDTWTRLAGESGKWLAPIYDPVTGLIVTRDLGDATMWAYDVDTETWTQVHQGSVAPPPSGTQSMVHTMAYDPDIDRIVLYSGDNRIGGSLWESSGVQTTWSFDLRTGRWTVEPAVTPELGWVFPGVYDESAHLSVFFGDEVVAGYDAANREWRILWQSENADSDGPSGHWSWVVYDPVNERVLAGDGDPKALWAFDSKTGEWLELLPAGN